MNAWIYVFIVSIDRKIFAHLAAYMHQWNKSALVQVMSWRLLSAQPLPEPMLAYCQLDPWEQISVKFETKFYNFHLEKMRLKLSFAKMAAILSNVCVCVCVWRGGGGGGGGGGYLIWPTRSRDILRGEDTLSIGTSAIMRLMGSHRSMYRACWGWGAPFILQH